jgi:hypothetical protein
MDSEKHDKSVHHPNPVPFSQESKKRIQTQIHRRKKAKAVLPLEDEWDNQSEMPPNLRTPSSKMKKSVHGSHS